MIPCLNEARTIGRCVEAAWHGIKAAGLTGEVIVADNGSSDGSRQIAFTAGARVVEVSSRGYGAALRAGFLEARGQIMVMGDADLSYDFAEIPRFVEEQRRSGADMVVGDRLGGRIMPGAMPWTHHHIGNPLISFTIRRLFRVPLHDCYCGLRLITRDGYRRLRLNATSMEFALEMIVQGSLVGLRFSQVPITLKVDGRDHSPHLRTVRDGYRSFRFLFQHASITSYGVPAGIAGMAGLALLVRALIVEANGQPASLTAAGAGMLLLVAWLLGILGIIARVFTVGFLGDLPDPQLKKLFGLVHLESGVLLSGLMVVGGAMLAIWLRSWPAVFQVGLTLCVAGLGTFIASFVVSLMGRAIPVNTLAPAIAPTSDTSVTGGEMATANPAARQKEGYRVATQQALAHAHRYNAWLVDTLSGAWQGSRTVLHVGCSNGNVTDIVDRRLRTSGREKISVVGVEENPEAVDRFRERFQARPDLEVVAGDIMAPIPELARHGPFDCALSFNTLERIDDDVAALRAIKERLRPGGRVGLLVPGGGDVLYGVVDAENRQFRRYTPGRLRARLEAAGFEVVSIRRVDMVGALIWYLKGKVFRSTAYPLGQMILFDRFVPLFRRLDSATGAPFGLSLAAVAQVGTSSDGDLKQGDEA
ncbi:MAG: glycosyltransferase [Acidimicrobiaceae bacterium]|nr:glycosyltransferase [Acidimicrobiaceae bacterium]